MQELYFFIRHTPFWAVPIMILGSEFAYLYWLRKKKANTFFCLALVFIGASANLFYVWAGGPDKSVKVIRKMHRDYK